MQFTYEYIRNIPVISFANDNGSLIDGDIDKCCDEILGLLINGVSKVVVDLRKFTNLNSFGLGELVNLRNFFLEKKIICTLIVNSTGILKLLDMVGIIELFEIVASEKEI